MNTFAKVPKQVFELGKEAFEKEENSSLVSKIHIEACWSCLNKERRTDAATRSVKDAEISSRDIFVYINVVLTIVRKLRLTVKGPKRAPTTCSGRLWRSDDLKRNEVQRSRGIATGRKPDQKFAYAASL